MITDPIFREWATQGLVWLPERGMGFYPIREPAPYDAEYWQKYAGYAANEQGRAITEARLGLVSRWMRSGELVDVGIGCGAFVEARDPWAPTFGYDVNPVAVDWLRSRDLWRDPYLEPVQAASFWDALEHIADAHRILANVREWAFLTVPVVPGSGPPTTCWRHFRTDEHCWYWTRDGLIRWMESQGFECMEHNTMESLLGRLDAHSFAFRRT